MNIQKIENSDTKKFMTWEEHQEELARQSSFLDNEEHGIGKIKRCIENMQTRIAEYETLLNFDGVSDEVREVGFVSVRRARLCLDSAISEFADAHNL